MPPNSVADDGDSQANAVHANSSLPIEEAGFLRAGAGPIAQFVLGTIPYASGVGALLAQQYASRQDERLRAFLGALVEDLEALREAQNQTANQILGDTGFVRSFFEVLKEAANSQDHERLRYLRQFLVNCARSERPDEGAVELFLRYVPRLAGSHLLLLSVIYELQRHLPASDRLGTRRLANVPVEISQLTAPHVGRQVASICVADLENMGLVVDWRTVSGTGAFGEGYCLTRNGLLFMRFVESDWGSEGLATE